MEVPEQAGTIPGHRDLAPVSEFGPSRIRPPTPRLTKRAQHVLTALGIVFAVLLGTTLGYHYLPVVTTCAIGNRIGEYNVTSPQIILNYPYHGGAGFNESGQNWTFSSGSVVLGNLLKSAGRFGSWSTGRGVSGLDLELRQPIFGVYAVHNVSAPASGGSYPCTQPYVAGTVSAGYCSGWGGGIVPIANPLNDSVEPHVFNSSCPSIPNGSGIRPGGYMWVDNTYPVDPAPGTQHRLDLCTWTSNFSQEVRGAVAVPVSLHVPYEGRTLSISGYLWWVNVGTDGPTASYTLPHGAIWRVATVGLYSEDTPGLLPPGLLAFERIPCP